MDKFIDARFERLEKALGGLIDSVTKYHPSTILAHELKAADAELAKVQTHQNNHLRILALRQASAAFDHQIRETLTSLSHIRRDVVATHITKFPSGPNYPIAYEELLSYARRISKTTLPPAATIHASAAAAASGIQTPNAGESQSQAVTPAAGGTAATTPQITTQSPGAIPNGMPHTNVGSHPPPLPPPQGGSGGGLTGLPEPMAQYLNPLSGQVFVPWPPEDKIRFGSMAVHQSLIEQGIDPRGYDPAAVEARNKQAEAERRQREEIEARAQEERARQIHEERERLRHERELHRERDQEEWRRASIAAAASAGGVADAPPPSGSAHAGPEKRQFQFTNLDDLDDDDDDDEED